jgi:membrane protease YdiL (CAAX protease family)
MHPDGVSKPWRRLRDELGLRPCDGVLLQPAFHFALAAGPVFGFVLGVLAPGALPSTRPALDLLLSLVLWQPLVEEVLFRGLLQGQLAARLPLQRGLGRISYANVLTSLLFAAAHLPHHAPAWAAAVFVPSLIFGYFRDRWHSILPALALHVVYNTCYYLGS